MGKRFLIELYDKDNDCITEIEETNNGTQARAICRALYKTIQRTYLLNKDSKYNDCKGCFPYEQFDWVQVYDCVKREVVYCNNKKYKGE